MRHVRIVNSSSRIVHLVFDGATATVCDEDLTRGTFDGLPVARVYDVQEPATCGRCRAQIRTDMNAVLKTLSLPDMEKIAEILHQF